MFLTLLRLRCAKAIALGALLVLATGAWAQTPARLRWSKGQMLTYRVHHETTITAVRDKATQESRTHLDLVKHWKVVSIDANGVATVEMSLSELNYRLQPFTGEPVHYSSTQPDQSTPELSQVMSQYVGKPIAVLRVDGQGRVVEVKESRFGSADSYVSKLPFVVLLPNTALQAGEQWTRPFTITLAPPQGTGEKHEFVQTYTCKDVTPEQATIQVATQLKKVPSSPSECVPLLQYLSTGEVTVDLQAGRMQRVTLQTSKKVDQAYGPDTSSTFQSSYTEEYVAQ